MGGPSVDDDDAKSGEAADNHGLVATKFLGIMRHAQQFAVGMDTAEEPELGRVLSVSGRAEVEQVARRLAEYVVAELLKLSDGSDLPALSAALDDVQVAHATTEPARETAMVVAAAIVKEALSKTESSTSNRPRLTELEWRIRDEQEVLNPGNAGVEKLELTKSIVIAVAHDPDATCSMHSRLRTGFPPILRHLAGRTSLRRAEIAMLKRADRNEMEGWEIDYVVSRESKEEIAELQEKLKSKMDTAKVLGAFLTGLAFFAGRELTADPPPLAWYPWVAGTGIGLLALAIAAYIVTMFLYDSLLMPTAFWPTCGGSSAGETPNNVQRWYRLVGTGQKPRRPPSSAATIILHSMQRVWGGMFVPATISAAVGAALVGIALAKPSGFWWLPAFGIPVAVLMGIVALVKIARPDLGHSD